MLNLLVHIFSFLLITQSSNPLSIESPDGDIIDCVHMREQPALNHPLLHDHEIQETPAKKINKIEGKEVWQVWNQNGRSCPDQSVPIRRSKVGDKKYTKKHWTNVYRTDPYAAEQGHEYAIAYPRKSLDIYGTQATISVWDPVVQPGANEFSLSQIWLVAGNYDGSDLNTIEAGWQVFPNHYHDNQPRLFIYWTSDTYQNTGCLNLECPGFVQVSSDFTLGAAFSPISTYGGNQYDVTMSLWKDTDEGNWWFGIGQSLIGYWPAKLFTHLADGPAKVVQWGGEVVNTRSYGQHTTTQMGSGHFAEEGLGRAGFIRNIRIIDHLYLLTPVRELKLLTLNSTCYNAKQGYNEEWGTHFYFGGPGFNVLCP